MFRLDNVLEKWAEVYEPLKHDPAAKAKHKTFFRISMIDGQSYFIRNYATSERDRERMTRLEDRRYTGLQSDFLITDDGSEGHVNRAVRRVVYGKDFTVSLLNAL